jgi:hypothetical protein
MNRFYSLAIALGLSFAATEAWATSDFDTFVSGRSAAATPLGSGDKVPVIQGGVTKYLAGNAFATLNDPGTFINKIISGSSNTLTVLAGSQLSGTVPVSNGGTALTSYTSGGVICATGATTLASSSALTANLPVIGAGAGVCPVVGSVSGNTTKFATVSGSLTNAVGVVADASGNLVSSTNVGLLTATQTWTGTQMFNTVLLSQNNQTTGGVNYPLVAADCGKAIYFTSATAATLTLLNTAGVGCTLSVEQGGAGQITVAPGGAGATFNNADNFTKTFGQYAVIGLQVDTNSGGNSAHYIFTGRGA